MKRISLRRAVLWVTGRDLMEPPLSALPTGMFWNGAEWKISGPPTPHWKMTFSADGFLSIHSSVGPSVLHRLAQRIAFGIRWRMLPASDSHEGTRK